MQMGVITILAICSDWTTGSPAHYLYNFYGEKGALFMVRFSLSRQIHRSSSSDGEAQWPMASNIVLSQAP